MADDFPTARFSVATFDWARDEHATLEDLSRARIDGERLRERASSQSLGRGLAAVQAKLRRLAMR